MLTSAEHVDDHEATLHAKNWMGIAYQLTGNLKASENEFKEILAADPPPDEDTNAAVLHHLAMTKSKQDEVEEANRLFSKSVEARKNQGNHEDMVRVQMAMAKHLMRHGDRDKALHVAKEALRGSDEVSDPRAKPSIQMLVEEIEGEKEKSLLKAPASISLDYPDSYQKATQEHIKKGEEVAKNPEQFGNLALMAWSAGDKIAAWAWSNKALKGYAQNGDVVGISRCLNNQARFNADEGKLEEACKLANRALEIRTEEGDLPGQALTLASIAEYEQRRERYRQAESAARRCLGIWKEANTPKHAVEAALVLFQIYTTQGNGIGVKEAASLALEALRLLDDPSLKGVREELEGLVSNNQEIPRGNNNSDPLTQWLLQGTNISRTGDVEKLLEHFDSPPPGMDLTTENLGQIEGTLANALQNAGNNEEAVEAYRRTSALFDKANLAKMSLAAKVSCANSLRRLGRWNEAYEEMQKASSADLEPDERSRVKMGMASILIERDSNKENEAERSKGLKQAETLLDEAEAGVLQNDEGYGILLIKRSNIAQLQNDSARESQLLEDACVRLRRVNSRHLELVEARLRQLKES
jgi:tetratricopeptide (TPR) repeat protein